MLSFVLSLLSVVASAEAPPTDAEVALLVEQLGARSFRQREAAQQQLLGCGQNAIALLRKAARESDNLERSRRAKQALAMLAKPRWTTLKRGFPLARKQGKLLLVFSTVGEIDGFS